MTVLNIAKTVCARLQLPIPTIMVGNTDVNVILIKYLIEEGAQNIRDEYSWPELFKEYTFTLATSTAAYALPSDLNRLSNKTLWNRTQHWPLIGPVDAVQWQNYKSGLITTLPRQRFRVKGWASKQFFIDPTPSSAENGQTVALEYQTKIIFRPQTWVTLTSWLGQRYCSYDGNIYDRGGTGAASTGATPPTHTSGTVSDGVISWTFIDTTSSAYALTGDYGFESILYDTDVCLLSQDLIVDRTTWRFKQERGLDFEDLRVQSEGAKESKITALSGADILSVSGRSKLPSMIGPWSYPEGNY